MTSPAAASVFPAVLHLPADAVDLDTNQVMGRRVAGRLLASAFASQLHLGETLVVVCPGGSTAAQAVADLVRPKIPASARVQMASQLNPGLLTRVGAVHFPDPLLARWCWLRDGLAPHAFSFTGVIHTLCSEGVLRGLQDLPMAPLYEWDAVVCTSTAGQRVVTSVLEQRLESMAARMGAAGHPAIALPQLPVIPLAGVTNQPYYPGLSRAERRRKARQALGLHHDAFVVAFVGRLSFHSKAHPQALYRALHDLDPGLGPVTLIECGHQFNAAIAEAYRALQRHFPRLDVRLVGGLTPATEHDKWQVLAAADVFTSPADNLQETFGLSLLEAMAAELPLVVSDWDGYRDLVQHGQNGLLVPTADVLPSRQQADDVERAYSAQWIDYDLMVGLRSLGVVIDHHAYTQAFRELRANPALRSRLAQQGRVVLEQRFSGQAVSRAHRQLWADLADRRAAAASAATTASARPPLPPFLPAYGRTFGHYASRPLTCERVELAADCLPLELVNEPIHAAVLQKLFGGKLEQAIQQLSSCRSLDVAWLEQQGLSNQRAQHVLAALLKLGLAKSPERPR